MPRYVAFLRAINVGGSRTVKMDVLRLAFESMGFSGVSSFIASGNIVFETPIRSRLALENRIEEALMQRLGYEVTPFIRTGPELHDLLAYKAFPKSAIAPGDESIILFLSAQLPPQVQRAVLAVGTTTDEFRPHAREVYWVRHRSAGNAEYATLALEKALGQPFTARSVRTVQKIADKYFPNG